MSSAINAPTPPTEPTPRSKPTPRAKSLPRPTPKPDPDAFVPQNSGAASKNPAPTSSREPFDIYVDAVRYIPDNASIVKVSLC